MSELLARVAGDLGARLTGPLHLRLVLQPAVAVLFATLDGRKDARIGKAPYGWLLLTAPEQRRELMQEGWKSVGKVFIAAVLIDLAFQVYALHALYIGEALIVGLVLALLPYVLLRGLVNRLSAKPRVPAASKD